MLFSHCVQLEITAVTQENVAHSQEVGQHRKRINCLQMLATILQGHPMDLFLKISVLQAHFCWLEDVKEIIVLGRKVLLGKR